MRWTGESTAVGESCISHACMCVPVCVVYAGIDYQPESPEWHPELQPVMCKARLTSSGTFSKSCSITATAMCCYD
jgi:hypothetical protein